MPKESEPAGNLKPNTRSRREFIEEVPRQSGKGAILAATIENITQAQEQGTIDNHIELFFDKADDTKINFPDNFKEVTPQIRAILLAIYNYQLAYLNNSLPDPKFLDGGQQEIAGSIDKEKILVAEKTVWNELKKFDPALPEFSEDNFFETLVMKVPAYFSDYGIYTRAKVGFISQGDKFLQPVMALTFLEIDKIERDEAREWGKSIPRDIIYIKGPVQITDAQIGQKVFTNPAETGFKNIMIFETPLRNNFLAILNEINDFGAEIRSFPEGKFLDIKQSNLEELNNWSSAIGVATVKTRERMKTQPTYEMFRAQKLNHETRHLIDRMEGDLHRVLSRRVTTSPAVQSSFTNNFRYHDEINPILAELKYGPHRESVLLYYLNAGRDDLPGSLPTISKPSEWIFRNMVNLISKEGPGRYGIKISETMPVSIPNQIVSQLNVLLDRPELFNELCEKLIDVHKQNLTEDLNGISTLTRQQNSEPKPTFSDPLLKVGVPAAVATGSAVLALEALRRRKNKVAEEKALAQTAKAERISEEIRHKKAKRKKDKESKK